MLLTLAGLASLQAQQPLGRQVEVHVAPQPWQVRRSDTIKVLGAYISNQSDVQAQHALDTLLTDYEAHPLSRTPLENLDLIGYFYAPKDGPEECLSVVVLNCILGWYDALRFGSESGRSELLDNEHIFGRAFILSGEGTKQKMTDLIENHPDKIKAIVAEGIAYGLASIKWTPIQAALISFS
jgi:hypothetical protein